MNPGIGIGREPRIVFARHPHQPDRAVLDQLVEVEHVIARDPEDMLDPHAARRSIRYWPTVGTGKLPRIHRWSDRRESVSRPLNLTSEGSLLVPWGSNEPDAFCAAPARQWADGRRGTGRA